MLYYIRTTKNEMITMNGRRTKPSPKKVIFYSDNDQDLFHTTNYHSTIVIEKFLLHKKRELESINQTIYFRDLVLRVKDGYGETGWHECSYKYHQSTEIRLRAHIYNIFKFAQEDHRANYCEQISDSTFRIKKDKENHITRLSTHEFSLYTITPLTLNEFGQLIEDIKTKAEMLEPNILIFLSSFAVLYQNDPEKIMNISISIQGGNQPVLHCFTKNSRSDQDINYNNQYKLFSQKNTISAEFISIRSDNNEILIYTGSVFELTTFGGAKYIQAFDICNDLTFGHSQQQIERLLLNKQTINQFIPAQMEHCISSFSINLQNDKLVSDKALHVDPNKIMNKKKGTKFGKKTFDQEMISNVLANNDYSTLIWDTKTGYFIVNPPFGRDYCIEVLEERQSAKPVHKYLQAINAYNNLFMYKRTLDAIQVDVTRNDKALIKHTGVSSTQNISFFSKRILEMHCKVDSIQQPHCNIF